MSDSITRDARVGICSPWLLFHKKVFNLFQYDDEIEVDTEVESVNGIASFNISSSNSKKLFAIMKILKNDIKFGNITLHINYVFKNEDTEDQYATTEDFENAFDGNPLFYRILDNSIGYNFAIFDNVILTYYADDMTDYCGNAHQIVADLVKEVTKESPLVHVCTKVEDEKDENRLGKPLGEWP